MTRLIDDTLDIALIALLSLLALTLMGCSSSPPVLLPVACEAPQVPNTPKYPVLSLSRSATDQETAMAYASSFRSCRAYADDLNDRLRALHK